MNSDDELSPELVSRLRELTKAKLTEKGEPLKQHPPDHAQFVWLLGKQFLRRHVK